MPLKLADCILEQPGELLKLIISKKTPENEHEMALMGRWMRDGNRLPIFNAVFLKLFSREWWRHEILKRSEAAHDDIRTIISQGKQDAPETMMRTIPDWLKDPEMLFRHGKIIKLHTETPNLMATAHLMAANARRLVVIANANPSNAKKLLPAVDALHRFVIGTIAHKNPFTPRMADSLFADALKGIKATTAAVEESGTLTKVQLHDYWRMMNKEMDLIAATLQQVCQQWEVPERLKTGIPRPLSVDFETPKDSIALTIQSKPKPVIEPKPKPVSTLPERKLSREERVILKAMQEMGWD